MTKSRASRILALLFLSALIVGWRAAAADFGLSVAASPNPVSVSNLLTYSINLTNASGATLTNVMVTNAFSANVVVLTNSSSPVPVLTNNTAIIQLDALTNGEAANLTLALLPAVAGSLTNTVTVSTNNESSVTTNVVTLVNTAVNADLAVSITGLATNVLVDDYMTFSVNVTNLGPDTVSNVFLTNAASGPVLLQRGVSPANQTSTLTNDFWVFNLGTLTNQAFRNLKLTVQPTASGTLTLFAIVTATNLADPNLTNNVATNSTVVQPFLSGQLLASIGSTQHYNPQTGLMEQTIHLTNAGTNDVASAIVIVSGLGLSNQLYNAVGTNGYNTGTNAGNPYVAYGAPLAINQSVDLALEYFVPTRLPVSDPALTALEIAAVNLTAPTNTSPIITREVALGAGNLLIEFQSIPGRSYTVVYSDNPGLSNALTAQPAIVAQADRTQWIDNGPPKTVSRPVDAGSRFYRVLLNP